MGVRWFLPPSSAVYYFTRNPKGTLSKRRRGSAEGEKIWESGDEEREGGGKEICGMRVGVHATAHGTSRRLALAAAPRRAGITLESGPMQRPRPQHWSQKRRRRPHRAGIALESHWNHAGIALESGPMQRPHPHTRRARLTRSAGRTSPPLTRASLGRRAPSRRIRGPAGFLWPGGSMRVANQNIR